MTCRVEKISLMSAGRRRRSLCTVVGLVLVCVLGSSGVQAAPDDKAAQPADPIRAMIQERLDALPQGEEGVNQALSEMNAQLDLSEAQQKTIRPILEKMVQSMQGLRDRFEAGSLSPMALGMQLQMAGQKTAKQIEAQLDTEQKLKYEKMLQDQRRQAMKAMQKVTTP